MVLNQSAAPRLFKRAIEIRTRFRCAAASRQGAGTAVPDLALAVRHGGNFDENLRKKSCRFRSVEAAEIRGRLQRGRLDALPCHRRKLRRQARRSSGGRPPSRRAPRGRASCAAHRCGPCRAAFQCRPRRGPCSYRPAREPFCRQPRPAVSGGAFGIVTFALHADGPNHCALPDDDCPSADDRASLDGRRACFPSCPLRGFPRRSPMPSRRIASSPPTRRSGRSGITAGTPTIISAGSVRYSGPMPTAMPSIMRCGPMITTSIRSGPMATAISTRPFSRPTTTAITCRDLARRRGWQV